MIRNVVLLVAALVVCPVTVLASCDPHDDGDCCASASDCIAYVHPAFCAVIPLNKTAAAKLEKDKLQPPDFCKPETIDQLRLTAKSKKPICLEGGCEFEEDNG